MSLETRKPITDLTPADLDAFPIWEYALDEEGVEGQDETWVRPLNMPVVPRNQYSLSVATEFRAVCGRIYPGFCIVTTAGQEVEIGAGVILHGTDYLPVDDREELCERTGLTEAELFPITYRLRVPIEGEQLRRSGTVV
jgi:hypothetical protein